jgi:glycosyltransferase involved in cell wall biosynthesis
MRTQSPKIIYLTAGAAGMFCGSCLHDNALTRAMIGAGWDIQLVPTYTPIRTDETDISVDHVLFGGLNVYLQQKIPLFRYLPAVLDHVLDSPRLIRRLTAKAIDTDAKLLGGLALSMLKGTHGNQRKEVRRMSRWLKKEKPDLLLLTNLLIGGCLEQLKRDLDVPVLVTLQGDNVFLDSLEEPWRSACMKEIKTIAGRVDGFIVHTEFFRSMMSEYFEIDPGKIHVTPLGIDVSDYQRFLPAESGTSSVANQTPERTHRTIGYLARLAPEKGLHNLVEAFIHLKTQPRFSDVKLSIAGWLGPPNLEYASAQWGRLNTAGLENEYEYLGTVERQQKLEFLASLDVFSVPADYAEPKGLYAFEAMAAGVPIVQPAVGTFPELISDSDGGLVYDPSEPHSLSETLAKLLDDQELRSALGTTGQQFVHQSRNAPMMAAATGAVIEEYL